MRFCLLTQASPRIEDDNYLRIGKALARRGHGVQLAPIDSLRLKASALQASGFDLDHDEGLAPGDPLPATQEIMLDALDVVWVLGLGERSSFLDKIQLLYTLRHAQVINSLDALMHFKSKYFLTSISDLVQHPITFASTDPAELMAVLQAQGGRWIAKPPAGSLGRDVFLVSKDDSNALAVLQHLCGPMENQYTLLQQYIPEIEQQGEKRLLMTAGKVIGQYQRFHETDHRTNVTLGARVEPASLADDERQYCERVAERLLQRGLVYFAMDMVYPWVIELNVVNPGGLATLEQLDGQCRSQLVADRVADVMADVKTDVKDGVAKGRKKTG